MGVDFDQIYAVVKADRRRIFMVLSIANLMSNAFQVDSNTANIQDYYAIPKLIKY